MKITHLAFTFVITLTLFSCGSNSFRTSEQDIPKLKEIVTYLASDELQGRETGSEGELKAAEFIATQFKDIGLIPMGDSASFMQNFNFVPKSNPHVMETADSLSLGMGTVKEINSRNVIGFIDHHRSNTVVIGAHFDHLGMGGEGSLFRGDGDEIHNGADDNASGVAALLNLAEFCKSNAMQNNYLFIAFSGEEKGLWGSNYYCKNPTYPLEQINYMINMDMVGRLKEEKTISINGVGTSPLFVPVLDSIQVDSLSIVTSESGVGPSDHTSFYLMEIPVLHFFTGQHEDYHKPTDDVEKINFEGLVSVTKYIEELIIDLDDDGKLEFTKTKDQDNENAPRFTVTLGVIPDYLFNGDGMRIDGISEDRIAQKAGMIKGDVVVKMGELDIIDMMSYMEGLSMFETGDTTTVLIDRDGERIPFHITFD